MMNTVDAIHKKFAVRIRHSHHDDNDDDEEDNEEERMCALCGNRSRFKQYLLLLLKWVSGSDGSDSSDGLEEKLTPFLLWCFDGTLFMDCGSWDSNSRSSL